MVAKAKRKSAKPAARRGTHRKLEQSPAGPSGEDDSASNDGTQQSGETQPYLGKGHGTSPTDQGSVPEGYVARTLQCTRLYTGIDIYSLNLDLELLNLDRISTTGRRAQAYLPNSNRLHTPAFCRSMYLSDYW